MPTRRSAAGNRAARLFHDGFEVGGVFRKIAHVACDGASAWSDIPCPRQSNIRHGKAARAQIARGLKIFLDVFGAALQHDHRAFAPGRRRPARKRKLTRPGFGCCGHHVVGTGLAGMEISFMRSKMSRARWPERLIVHDLEKGTFPEKILRD